MGLKCEGIADMRGLNGRHPELAGPGVRPGENRPSVILAPLLTRRIPQIDQRVPQLTGVGENLDPGVDNESS